MSDLFMDMHRCRWHTHQTTPPMSTSTTTTSESPSSTQNIDTSNHNTFSHHNSSTANGADAASNANYNYNNRKECKEEKHDNNDDDDDDNDELANIISLKLRKPKHWNWELTTSKSCSNIALPRILLYNHKNQLLVDAHGDDNKSVYKQNVYEKPKRDKSKKRSHQSKQAQSQYHQRSATTNLTHSIRNALEKEFNGLQIQEATPSPEPYSHMSNHSSHRSRKAVDFNTTDLPDYGLSRRSSSLKGVRFIVEDDEEQAYYESQIPEFLPTPPSTTTPTSSSSGPREKRKYRRSHSSGRSSVHSGSILERFSYQKGRFSSPECSEEKDVQYSPRYFLRTSKAGTLVVQEDSFSQHPRRRRRPLKNCSTESLQSMQKFSLSSTSPAQQQTASNSPFSGELSRNRKQQLMRRHFTDGNILLNKQLSTSEEDIAVGVDQKQLMDNINSKHLRKYVQARNKAKALDYSPDVHQNGKVR